MRKVFRADGVDVQITVEDLSPVKKKIGVALPPEEVRAEMDDAYRGLQRRARIKGFRPGHVPRAILERYYGDQVRSEVLGKLIQDSYARALEEHHLEAVARPEIVAEDVQPETGIRYSATIEIKPAFQVVGYDGLAVERPVVAVDDEAVEAQLERMRQSLAQMAPNEAREQVEQGDLVEVAYTGVVDGRALAGAASESRVIEVGAQAFPPPFEERLIGLRRGASTHIDVPYPAHHRSREIAGKTVTFRVEVKEIGRKELPALDDEFAKDHGACGSLTELRARVRQDLEAAAEREADDAVRAAVVRQLVERNPIEVPQSLVDRRFEGMAHDLGVDHADTGGDAKVEAQLERIRTELRQRAVESIHSALVLERLATQQGLAVTPAEIDERISQALRTSSRERERLAELYRAPEARREIAERIAQQKALDWLVGRTLVTPTDSKLIADTTKKS